MEFESPPHLGGHASAHGPVPVYAPGSPPSPAPSTPSRRRAPFAMVGGLVVLALVAVALLAFTGRRERSAEERLSAAQSFVAGTTSVHLDFDVEATISAGEPGSRASSVSTERMGGSVDWTPHAWRVHQESRYGEDETILVDRMLYTRSAFSGSTLDDELWYEEDYLDPNREEVIEAVEMYAESLDDDSGLYSGFYDEDSLGVVLGAAIYIGGLDRMTDLSGELIDDPVGFAETIQQLDDATILDRADGVTTLEATLRPPADLVEAFGHPIPTGIVELDLDAFDIPQAMRLSGELVTIPVDDYTWLLVTSETVAMVMIDADEDAPFEQIIASFEVVDWAMLQQHTEGTGF